MTTQCKCGGRFRRTDIKAVPNPDYPKHPSKYLYQDTDPEKANWQCDKCSTVRTQRKRQPGK